MELAAQAVDDDLEVQLAHPGDDRLRRLGIDADLEARVLEHQHAEGGLELELCSGVGLGGGSMAIEITGSGHDDRLEDDGLALVAQGVAGRGDAQADGGGDVAAHDVLHIFALVGVHAKQAADPLALPLGRVPHGRLARLETPE